MSRTKKRLLAAGILGGLLLILGAGILLGLIKLPKSLQASLDMRKETDAVKGSIKEESRGKENFRIILNQVPTIREGEKECSLEYENPEGNAYQARVSLYDEEGNLVGNTGILKPGEQIEKVKLKKKYKAGEWPVTVQIDLFEEDHTNAGKLTVGITLRVLEEKEEGEQR
ncbi:hypothetical protein [Anaerolentibacter hominis]|uniref:hypothetical protein n=1 Tax=Anaerolentibacter hominis TaxID=3079009 RepID=UPI0031B82DAF